MVMEQPGAQYPQSWNSMCMGVRGQGLLLREGRNIGKSTVLEGHQYHAKEFKFLVNAELPIPTHLGHGRQVPRSHRFTFGSSVDNRGLNTGQVCKQEWGILKITSSTHEMAGDRG